MSAVAWSTIRQRFKNAVDAIAGFSESRNPYDNFGRNPNTVAHLRFAIGLTSTAAQSGRQKQAIGIVSNTTMSVRFAYRIRPKDQISSYDDALDTAQSVIQSCTNRTAALYTNTQIKYDSMSYTLANSGEYMIFDVYFLCLHQIPLA